MYRIPCTLTLRKDGVDLFETDAIAIAELENGEVDLWGFEFEYLGKRTQIDSKHPWFATFKAGLDMDWLRGRLEACNAPSADLLRPRSNAAYLRDAV